MKFLIFLVVMPVIWTLPGGNLLTVQWRAFKSTHNRNYENIVEEHLRMKIFSSNLEKIALHNAMFEKGLKTFSMEANQFADMTADEFMAYVTKYPVESLKLRNSMEKVNITHLVGAPPASLDWRQYGVVTAVKDQQSCGSCWSFSATGAMEGQHAFNTGTLVSLSEQNLIDCSHEPPNNGCNGGNPYVAFMHVQQNGINTESDYPYENRDNVCRFNPSKSVLKVYQPVALETNNEDQFAEILSIVGPISVLIHVKTSAQFYKSGIYQDGDCDGADGRALNHAVLAVGFGSTSNGQYWLLKNSWGPNWGAAGYMILPRNRDNYCGIISAPFYPIIL